MSSRSYLTGRWRRRSKSKVESTLISLPAALRNAFVHFSFRGLSFALKARWHLERQKWNTCEVRGRAAIRADNDRRLQRSRESAQSNGMDILHVRKRHAAHLRVVTNETHALARVGRPGADLMVCMAARVSVCGAGARACAGGGM
jgi:hypothetical protein